MRLEIVRRRCSQAARAKLDAAVLEAKREHARVVDTRDLLLVLAADFGVWPEVISGELLRETSASYGPSAEPATTTGEWPVFTDALLAVLDRAFEIAQEYGKEVIEPRHLAVAVGGFEALDARLLYRAIAGNSAQLDAMVDRVRESLANTALQALEEGEKTASPFEQRVVALVYLLMRDEVVPGKLFRMIESLATQAGPFNFSSRELEQLAVRYTHRLM